MYQLAYLSAPILAIEKIAVFLVMITLVVSLHELGHFIVARRFGVFVKTFAIGFGRKVAAVRSPRSGTLYQLNLLPMGGYCRLKAVTEQDPASIGPTNVSPIWAARSYDIDALESKTPLQRLAIMVAGPLVNFAIAIPFLIVAYAALGTVAPTVILTAAGGPADRAGIQPGDRIATVRTTGPTSHAVDPTTWWTKPSAAVLVSYRHGSQTRSTVLAPAAAANRRTTYGIEVKVVSHRLAVGDAVARSGQTFASIWNTTWSGIGSLVLRPRETIAQFSGPVGLARSSGQVQDYGWGSYLTFAAVISISLGVFNVLPIPGLDGGQIAFVILEMIRGGKRLTQKQQNIFNAGGIAVLMALFALTTFQDISALHPHQKS